MLNTLINIVFVLLLLLNFGWAVINFHYREWMLMGLNITTMVLLILCMVERWR